MKSTLRIVLCATALSAAAAYAADGVTRILDRGRDGDIYYYEVLCEDGSRGSIQVSDAPPNTCAHSTTLAGLCNADWSLRDAARRICQ